MDSRTPLRVSLLVICVAICGVGSAAPQSTLLIPWPHHWEYRYPFVQDGTIYFEARQQVNDVTSQRLRIRLLDISQAKKTIDSQLVRDLVIRLRSASLAAAGGKETGVTAFDASVGYYFVTSSQQSESPGQTVEGVLLSSGHLVYFTLVTHDAESIDTKDILAALGKLRIQ